MPAKKWTTEQLREAVRTSFNFNEVLRKLNLKICNTTTSRVKNCAEAEEMDISHFRRASYSNEQLADAIRDSASWAAVMRQIGITTQGNNIPSLKRAATRLGIDFSHIIYKPYVPLSNNNFKPIPVEEYLIEGKTSRSSALKKKIVEAKLFPDVCAICGQLPHHFGKPLVLQLDHINSIHNDNRLENLRIVCPNCHTQTEHFAGRGKANRYKRPQKQKISQLGIPKLNIRKVERPSKEQFEKEIWSMPTMELAKKYRMSDKALEKWCKSYGIQKPPVGFWNKVKVGATKEQLSEHLLKHNITPPENWYEEITRSKE